LLASRPNPTQEDHPLLAVRDCLFNIFADALHIGGRFSTCNLRARHAVVTGTHDVIQIYFYKISVCSIDQNVTKLVLIIPPRIQFVKLFFLLKNLIFNTLSDIISDLTSFDFVVFVVMRRLVLLNFKELQ